MLNSNANTASNPGFLKKYWLPVVLLLGVSAVALLMIRNGIGVHSSEVTSSDSDSVNAFDDDSSDHSSELTSSDSDSVNAFDDDSDHSSELTSSGYDSVNASDNDCYRMMTCDRGNCDDSINYRLNDCTPPNVPGSDDVNSFDDDSKVFVEWYYNVAYYDLTGKPTEKDQSNDFVEMTRAEAVTKLADLRKLYRSSGVDHNNSRLSFRVRENMQTETDYFCNLYVPGVPDGLPCENEIDENASQKFEEDVQKKLVQWEKEQDAQPL
eukprot:963040_1